MSQTKKLSDKWIKGVIIGTVWASFEIILGSFLHNLRVPFSGNILTAIGLIVLISSSYKWQLKGIFWRAGLICALMKTLSPSAVIFGPMVAIFTQALFMEISVLLLGYNYLGYGVGAVLAMTSNLFQKILNWVIFYGLNLIEIYESLMNYAQRQLQLNFDTVWMPIVLLTALYIIFALITTVIGIKTGKQITERKKITIQQSDNALSAFFSKKKQANFAYSLPIFLLNIVLLIGTIALSKFINFYFWILICVTIIIFWSVRYKRALRQLLRPRLWLFFVAITFLSALIFSQIQQPTIGLKQAIVIGVEMNFRAIIIILGLTAIGTELYNPTIKNRLKSGKLSSLSLALELSTETLPAMIAATPNVQTIFKNPMQTVQLIMQHADNRINEITRQKDFNQKIIIVTGKKDSGKTSAIKEAVKELSNHQIGGIITKKVYKNDTLKGYNILNLTTNQETPFLSLNSKSKHTIGRFSIDTNGLIEGKRILQKAIETKRIIIIDEVGRLELQNNGWAEIISEIVKEKSCHLIMIVNTRFADEICKKWDIEPTFIINSNEQNLSEKISVSLWHE